MATGRAHHSRLLGHLMAHLCRPFALHFFSKAPSSLDHCHHILALGFLNLRKKGVKSGKLDYKPAPFNLVGASFTTWECGEGQDGIDNMLISYGFSYIFILMIINVELIKMKYLGSHESPDPPLGVSLKINILLIIETSVIIRAQHMHTMQLKYSCIKKIEKKNNEYLFI